MSYLHDLFFIFILTFTDLFLRICTTVLFLSDKMDEESE